MWSGFYLPDIPHEPFLAIDSPHRARNALGCIKGRMELEDSTRRTVPPAHSPLPHNADPRLYPLGRPRRRFPCERVRKLSRRRPPLMLTSHHSQRSCGTTISDEQVKAAEAHFKANKVTPSGFAAFAPTINVHFHVVNAGTTLAQGNVPSVHFMWLLSYQPCILTRSTTETPKFRLRSMS